MTDDDNFRLSRRQALTALGTVGVASAGAGLGTSAYFSDTESFDGNSMVAGELDLLASWKEVAYQGGGGDNIDYYVGVPEEELPTPGTGKTYEGTEYDVLKVYPGGTGHEPEGTTNDLPNLVVGIVNLGDFEGTYVDEELPTSDAAITDPCNNRDEWVNGDEDPPEIDLTDVKPGDFGEITLDFHLCGNPGYVWLNGSIVDSSEGDVPEPESADEHEEDGVVELLDAVQTRVWYDNGDNIYENGETEIFQGSLRELFLDAGLGSAPGLQLDADTSSDDVTAYQNSTTNYVGIEWWVPPNGLNEIMADSVTFDLGFYTEQERHNDGSGQVPDSIPGTVGSGDFSDVSYEKAFSMQALSSAGSGRGEIQIHGDSGGVENTTLWGSDPGDTFPANQDVGFTAQVDPSAETASLSINGVTVIDNDVTDGDANGASTGDPEWPSGVPSEVDVALTASSGDSAVTTIVKDVTINGTPVNPDAISAQGDLTYLKVLDISASSTVTLDGTLRFEGSTSDFDGQDFVGIDWR